MLVELNAAATVSSLGEPVAAGTKESSRRGRGDEAGKRVKFRVGGCQQPVAASRTDLRNEDQSIGPQCLCSLHLERVGGASARVQLAGV